MTRHLALGQSFRVERSEQRAGSRAEQRPGRRHALRSADRHERRRSRKPGDVDCFKFTAKKGQVFDVRVMARAFGSPLDAVLNVYRIGGPASAATTTAAAPTAICASPCPKTTSTSVIVHDHLKQGGADYAYRVEVAPVQADADAGLPERSQYVDIVAPVPQGNRMAFLVNASRADFGGELNFEFKDLPPGVTVETLPMPANRSDVPVLLTAAADAPLSAARWSTSSAGTPIRT